MVILILFIEEEEEECPVEVGHHLSGRFHKEAFINVILLQLPSAAAEDAGMAVLPPRLLRLACLLFRC